MVAAFMSILLLDYADILVNLKKVQRNKFLEQFKVWL